MKRFSSYLKFLRPVRAQFALAIVLGTVYGVSSGFGLPFASQMVFPVLFGPDEPSTGTLAFAVLMLPAVFLIRGCAAYLNGYLMVLCGTEVVKSIQLEVYRKLQSLPLQFFHTRRSGDLMARVLGDTSSLQSSLTYNVNELIKQPLTFVSALGALIYLSFQKSELVFVLICLAVIPILLLPIRWIGRAVTPRARDLRNQAGAVSSSLKENLSAAAEIRMFNLQQLEMERFHSELDGLQSRRLRLVAIQKLLSPSVEFLAMIGVAVAIFYAAQARVTLDSVIPLLFALSMCYQPLKTFGSIHNQFQVGLASLDRLEVILHHDDTLKDPLRPVPLDRARGDIEFSNVTFEYNADVPVLRDVDEKIPAGSIVALVGPSGAGKSTFANLIPRLFEASQGSVRIDGVDVRDYLKSQLRSQIATVPQDPVLFNDSVRANIAVGRPDASNAEIVDAARNAFAHDFIAALEEGYDTRVGERGVRLSGGQKQRIAIARAFLKNAPILILDEATSNLDSESEAMIQQALARLVRGRTTLIIAHRFSTLEIADRLLLLEGGRIIGSGTSDELLAKSDRYRSLYERQAILRSVS